MKDGEKKVDVPELLSVSVKEALLKKRQADCCEI